MAAKKTGFHPLILTLLLTLALASCVLPASPTVNPLSPATSTQTTSPDLIATSTQPVPSSIEPTISPSSSTPAPSATPILDPAPTLSPTPAAPPLAEAEKLPEYAFTAVYDYPAHTLTVSEQITYTNLTSQIISQLHLVVEANRYPGSFALGAIAADGQALGDCKLEGNQLEVPLLRPLAPGESTTLALDYTLVLPQIPPPSDEARPQPYGFTVRQANLVDWYPYIPPYQEGVGWLAHEPGYFGEHQVLPLADFHLRLRIPEIGHPLIPAASAPAVREGDTYLYDFPAARTFALSISPAYEVLSKTVAETTVYSYFFSFNANGGQAALDDTAAALALYQDLFGAYTHKTLSVVQADFLDGMEFDGLYFLSRGFYNIYDGTPKGYLTAIAVHETAHQWWYGQVGNDQALEPWLDEALCTYAERLYYEHYYPELVDWWWAYRVDFYQPHGPINGTIYDYPSFRTYRDAVYLGGANFLEALRQLMGDEAFFAALRDYASQLHGKTATGTDFFAIFQAHSTEDITPLRAEYFK